jgi:carboxymethylenebutenolidase
MASEKVSISINDGFFDAYVSLPPEGSGPGILLIQEIFGVNSHMRDVADRLAAAGFIVMVPDLFWRMKPGLELGYEGADFDKALGYFQQFDEDKGMADLKEAASALRDHKKCTGRVGIMGFCLGGKLAFRLGSQFNFNAAVSYYPVSIEKHLDEAARLRCETIIHFAELDQFVPLATYEKIAETLKEKANIHIYMYKGVDHGFNCDARGAYNKEAADLAWSRSLEILNKELKG